MVGGEAVLKCRIARCVAPFDRHAAGDPGDLGSIGLAAADQRPDDRRRRIGVEDFRFRIQRIAAEQRAIHRDVVKAEDCAASAVGLACHADQPLQSERADHERSLPRGRRGIVRVVMQHRTVQRVQRLVRIVLLRQGDAGAMAEALSGRNVFEIEAVAFLIAVVVDAVVSSEHGASLRAWGISLAWQEGI
jgi:hypothetical protein